MRILLIGPLLLFLAAAAFAGPGEGELSRAEETQGAFDIPWSTIGAGGAPGASANFRSNGTLGQSTPIGLCGSANIDLHAGFWRKIAVATGVLEDVLPPIFRNALLPNAPNPFNPATTIRYETAEAGPVEIVVYGVGGRAVRTLIRETLGPGPHETVWDGTDDRGAPVGSGVYFCALRIGATNQVRKMVLVK
ncbi:MAG: hypothetical protein JW958_13650 [Candidatus Eisenbacteria bacterium]|nr:hypothetical protein [Candidatus Eisenbacteria bacterium]